MDLKALTGGVDGVVEHSQYKPQTQWQDFFRVSEDKTQIRTPGTVRFQGLQRDRLAYLKSQECVSHTKNKGRNTYKGFLPFFEKPGAITTTPHSRITAAAW